jgi:hypothetical protein
MTEVEEPWEDLASRQPGGAARAQAAKARAAAPVRTVLGRLMSVHTDERAWRIGAAGEVRVARQLDKLMKHDPRWRCLHAIPVGQRGADIDHLLIGPGGVFTLNTKHHPGARIWVGGETLLVNGVRQPYIRNSRHEAARACRLLSAATGFPVTAVGVIVSVGAEDVTVKNPPTGVQVVTRRRLRRWLARQPQTLDPAMIAALFDRARRSTTWTDGPSALPGNQFAARNSW